MNKDVKSSEKKNRKQYRNVMLLAMSTLPSLPQMNTYQDAKERFYLKGLSAGAAHQICSEYSGQAWRKAGQHCDSGKCRGQKRNTREMGRRDSYYIF